MKKKQKTMKRMRLEHEQRRVVMRKEFEVVVDGSAGKVHVTSMDERNIEHWTMREEEKEKVERARTTMKTKRKKRKTRLALLHEAPKTPNERKVRISHIPETQ